MRSRTWMSSQRFSFSRSAHLQMLLESQGGRINFRSASSASMPLMIDLTPREREGSSKSVRELINSSRAHQLMSRLSRSIFIVRDVIFWFTRAAGAVCSTVPSRRRCCLVTYERHIASFLPLAELASCLAHTNHRVARYRIPSAPNLADSRCSGCCRRADETKSDNIIR